MRIDSDERRQPSRRSAAMIDREALQRAPNPGRKPEKAVRRKPRSWLQPHSGHCGLASGAGTGHLRPSEAGIRGIPGYCIAKPAGMKAYLIRKLKRLRIRIFPTEEDRLEAIVGPLGAWTETAAFQIAFLKQMGLRPHHRVLDIGCGPLRGGFPLIEYLRPGGYTGVDIREAAIAEGKARIEKSRLADRKPVLVRSDSFGTEHLQGQGFDYIWVFQVLHHLDDASAQACLTAIAEYMTSQSVCFANVHTEGRRSKWQEFPFVPRSVQIWQGLTRQCGLEAADIGRMEAFGYPRWRKSSADHMLRIST
jgi:SAM-dependent methyltransferase